MRVIRNMHSFLFLIIVAVATFNPGNGHAQVKQDPVPIGNDACKACHVTHEKHQRNVFHNDCEACHTATIAHLDQGGRGNITFPDSGRCLICHQYNDHKRMHWMFSDHAKAGIECRQCHGNHSPKVRKQGSDMFRADRNSVLCMQCHQDIAARMRFRSHHPVREGALACTSCHDPHESDQTSLLGTNERCTRCHQSIRGPRVFEHAPVAEDCTICHDPHGSPNRRLLQLAQPMLCLQCHAIASNMHGRNGLSGAQMRDCTNCHRAVHGSHIDPILQH